MQKLIALVVLLAGGTAAAQAVVPSRIAAPSALSGAGAQSVVPQPSAATTQDNVATQQNSPTVSTPQTGQSTSLPSVAIPTTATGVPPTNAPAFPGLGAPNINSPTPSTSVPTQQALETRGAVALDAAQLVAVQTQLQAFGFYRGPIDGTLSAGTRSGLRAFQEAARIPATGIPDAATIGALGVVAASQSIATPTNTTPSTTAITNSGAGTPATITTTPRAVTPFPLGNGPTSAGEDQQFFIQP